MSLLELIVKSGIADAINNLPDGIKANKGATAETIANNVRSKIIKEQLTDPAYYGKMSVLLDEIIQDLKAKRLDYQEYLNKIADLAKQVWTGQDETIPEQMDTPGRRALYNNLEQNVGLATQVDDAVKTTRPDGWRGVQAREQIIKAALYGVLQDVTEVERIFLIITQQPEY